MVHNKEGFRAPWFESVTRIAYQKDVAREAGKGDVLVLPEIVKVEAADAWPEVSKVIFNQNAYYTFINHPKELADKRSLYTHPEVMCAVVESEDSRQYLQWVYPKLTVHRVKVGIDEKLFYPGDPKKRIIALMPRKQGKVVQQVLGMLKHRGSLAGWTVRVIENRSEEETARLLRESMVFLSFGHPEGFGLPPAEAMACGCVVIGFHGNGGREFFTPEHGFPIEVGDVLGYAQTVEAVAKRIAAGDGFEQMRRKASKFILATYSLAEERRSVVECWGKILQSVQGG